MSTLVLGLLLVGTTALLGYTLYVCFLVRAADFYSRPQKIIQCLMALLLPLLGAALVHWFYRLHLAKPYRPDRAFIPGDDRPPDDWRAFHRPPDPPGG